MTEPIQHPQEPQSNLTRQEMTRFEPRSLRTFTPTQAVLARSAGIYHWTPEGRRLYDFTSGVLVANLGHNPTAWTRKFFHYLGWEGARLDAMTGRGEAPEFIDAPPLTAYNAVTPVEVQATRRLIELMRGRPGGARLEQALWAASGSEAIQKALWAALARDRTRDVILATRFGFHGKKGLANAVTGSEMDHDRDPRVRFVSFPTAECADVAQRQQHFDPAPYLQELEALKYQFGRRLGAFITEPYLGGGGSYHPHKGYLQAVQQFCRDNDIVFILDEVQANFGRTGKLFAYEAYGLEPDIVVLGKGLANGIPVAAAVGSAAVLGALTYGEGSDTWSANPVCCAAVLATLDAFAERDVIAHCNKVSAVIESGLLRLKELPFIAHLRGEEGGMVWGIETRDYAGQSAAEWANAIILQCYRGRDGEGIHLLGALAKKVLRVAPPLVITQEQARDGVRLMHDLLKELVPAAPAKPAAHVLAAT